jgi:uncharacterized protein YaeQ
VALGSVVHVFNVQLSHVDRGVYETLELRVARHPSETEEFLCARVLAYGLELREGLAFSKGLAEPDEPALSVRDLTGRLAAWIEVGAPDAARLHRASKASPRVAVYTHHQPGRYWESLAGEKIHRADALELYGFDRDLIAGFASRLARRMAVEVSVSDRMLYLTIDGELLSGPVTAHKLTA